MSPPCSSMVLAVFQLVGLYEGEISTAKHGHFIQFFPSDGDGWQVCKDVEIEVSQNNFLNNFPALADDHQLYGVPHPLCILGMHFSPIKIYPHLTTQKCERPHLQTSHLTGHILTLFLAIIGMLKPRENVWQLCHFGCTVMTCLAMFQRSGMNTTASCSPSLVYWVMKPPKNSIFIFYAPQTWHLLLKCLMVLLTNLSMSLGT